MFVICNRMHPFLALNLHYKSITVKFLNSPCKYCLYYAIEVQCKSTDLKDNIIIINISYFMILLKNRHTPTQLLFICCSFVSSPKAGWHIDATSPLSVCPSDRVGLFKQTAQKFLRMLVNNKKKKHLNYCDICVCSYFDECLGIIHILETWLLVESS